MNELQENPGPTTIEKLIFCIVTAQQLMLKYKSAPENKERMARAMLKMTKAEEVARGYHREHEGAISSFDLEIVFEAYHEAFKRFFV